MIIRKDKTFETCSLYPNKNWYEDEDNYVIDETTEEGKQMAELYIENYPFVDFEYDGKFVTNVIILDKPEKPEEIEGKRIVLKQGENGKWYYDYEDIPLTPEEKTIQRLERDNINNMKAMVELHMKILELEGKL